MQHAFGMDVQGYRRYKGLTTAAKDAVVASAKAEIQRHSGKVVANPGGHLRRVA